MKNDRGGNRFCRMLQVCDVMVAWEQRAACCMQPKGSCVLCRDYLSWKGNERLTNPLSFGVPTFAFAGYSAFADVLSTCGRRGWADLEI